MQYKVLHKILTYDAETRLGMKMR